MPASILIVDDEKHTRDGLRQALEDDYDVYLASDADEAFNLMEAEEFAVVLTDLRMAGKSGMKVIDKALSLPKKPICIMMTAYGSVDVAVEAMKRGATDFLTKPVNLEELDIIIRRALKSRRIEHENEQMHARLDERFSFRGIVGQSKAVSEVIDNVKRVAPSKATILIEGETGTGKELIAQAIHQNSPRSKGPFITVNCAALPPTLLESELFGHEKGAFTGASERRIGRFEAADGGTLFLDEIGEIDASTQVKLLRFLEQRTIERIGSLKPLTVDARLVAATNRILDELVRKGKFREDLFYRLNVVRLQMPPLRERKDDIPLLLDHFINEYSRENAAAPVTIAPETMKLLLDYRWPGNIRELRNFAENIVIMRRGARIGPLDLDLKFHRAGDESLAPEGNGRPRSLLVEDHEKRLLRDALIEARGNRTRAAELLGVSRRTLHRKLAQWPDLDIAR